MNVVKLSRKARSGIAGYLFLTPWLLGLLAFTAIPMIASLYFSFTDYDMLTDPVWSGINNYKALFADPKFRSSLVVTFKFVFISVPLQLAFALFIAVILKQDRRGAKIYRAIYYLPSLFGGSVAVAILWKELFNKEGVFNQILGVFGIEGINWIATPSTALNTLIVLAVWQFGASMVIFLSSLKQIPQDYYEAATIDGASKPKQFFSITLPLLTPMVFFNVVMQIINAFQSFTSAYIVSGGTGGPMDSTLFYSLYLYTKGFRQFSMGYASAMAWILLLIIGVVTALLFASAKKWVYYD
ncbi:carbohydrate ABC transporter permease [Massiliimalia timonensis]|uniref:Sugar ABC transporter permease n=1 Tax=Massiliimalia timonensis TaxID=1987501 RepID=A0A8J6TWL2_9FIRM|nr:sugar ABC transporter permease [Massiliimalia timonensis]MBC8609910.1 sugar ABC transporter permease [Massiliimalia timonensis]MBS7175695.1 sugar ABC transporter permease [Clostridiales bacterium]